MECPFCGKIENDVIDSRLTPEGNAIRRRRQCSACAMRFTTYESTPEHFLFLLMKQHTAKGARMKRPETMLAFMSSTFKGLTSGVERLAEQLDEIEKAKAVRKLKKKPVAKPTVKAKPKKKKRAPVRKKIIVRKPKETKKAKKVTATDKVLEIIKRHKKGVDITKLKNKTGFADSKLRMIVSRAYKQGKIKRIARGVYVAA